MKRFEQLEALEIGMSTSPLGSGGMRSKVVAAEMATAAGHPALILKRHAPGRGRGGARGRRAVGTRFHRRRGACRASSSGSSTPSRRPAGSVDEGAELALRERGTSLLPVGVVGWTATSRRATLWRCPADRRVRSARASSTTRPTSCGRIKGMKSAEVQRLLPRASEEAVHRDYFVLG